MDRYKVAIVDDDELSLDNLVFGLQKFENFHLEGTARNGVSGKKLIAKVRPDLLFLDVELPDMRGMDLLDSIRESLTWGMKVVFYTAYDKYMMSAIRQSAFDYLLKPFAYTDFLKAAQKALQWFELSSGTGEMHSPDKSYIFVKSDYKLKQIPLDKVLYIEGLKDYVKIYLEDEPHPILSLLSLKSLEEMLPDSRFIRVHRSFIVQGCKIKMIDRNRIVFGKEYIPISDTYKDSFAEFISRHTPLSNK